MGLRDDIQAGVAEAFDGDLADAVKPFTGSRQTTSGTYDPATDSYPTVTVEYSGRGVFGGFKAMEIDGTQIMATDIKLTALQNEVTDTPQVDDTINGYQVVNVGGDPASATWRLQLRRT